MERMEKNGVEVLPKNVVAAQHSGKGQVDWWNKPHYKNPEVQKYSTVLFVPPTPGGALAKQMQLRETQINSGTDDRIKVVERGGQKLKSILVQNKIDQGVVL